MLSQQALDAGSAKGPALRIKRLVCELRDQLCAVWPLFARWYGHRCDRIEESGHGWMRCHGWFCAWVSVGYHGYGSEFLAQVRHSAMAISFGEVFK